MKKKRGDKERGESEGREDEGGSRESLRSFFSFLMRDGIYLTKGDGTWCPGIFARARNDYVVSRIYL